MKIKILPCSFLNTNERMSESEFDTHQRARRAQTCVERIKLQKSTTQLSLNTKSVYQTQKRYPKSLYKNKNLADVVKLKPFEIGGVFYTQNNESSNIYAAETLIKSATSGLDDGRRRNSLSNMSYFDENDSNRCRPFSYLHRLPTALYRNENQNNRIQVKFKILIFKS